MSDLSNFMEEKRTSPLDDFNYDRIEEAYHQHRVDTISEDSLKVDLIGAYNYFRWLIKDGSEKQLHKENVKILIEEMEKRDINYYGR